MSSNNFQMGGWYWDRISKKCWIEVDEGMYQSLKEMELYEGRQNK